MNGQKIIITAGLITIALCAGCVKQRNVVKNSFLLETQPPGTSAQKSSTAILAVSPFSIAPGFQDSGIIYRTGDNQYLSDYYNQYVVSPAAMITSLVRNWLSDADICADVLLPHSTIEPTHILDGNIRQIYVDVRDKARLKAVLEISFVLMKQYRNEQIIQFSKTYRVIRPVTNKTAKAEIDALNQCLDGVLTKLRKDISGVLQGDE